MISSSPLPTRHLPTALLPLLLLLAFPLHAAEPSIPDSAVYQNGILEFPSGVHYLQKTIEFRLAEHGSLQIIGRGRARLVMLGAGPAIRLVGTHDGTADPKTVNPNVWDRENAPTVRDLEIIGDHPDCHGVELVGTMQTTLKNLTIRRTHDAIRLAQRNRNVIISDCHLYENRGVGVHYDHVNLHQSNLTGCHISYNEAGGVVIRGGDVRNVHITGCDIEGNMGSGKPTANVLLDADGGSIGEVAITGCTIQHTHESAGSANIRMNLLSPKRSFADELRHGNITISGNVLSDTRVNIDIRHARGVAITGNTIWKGYDRNIDIRDSASIVLSGNVMDRNERYHYGDGSSAKLGVRIADSSRCTLSANVLTGVGSAVEAAIDVIDSEEISIIGCTITDYPKHGVRLTNCVRSQVDQSMIAPAGEDGRQILRVARQD
ncbi:MAG: right-handed parallel beta-helix repeat-containing protein [Planctomycetota bacterium]